jgi:cobalt-zinc-cadmium efflux system protein
MGESHGHGGGHHSHSHGADVTADSQKRIFWVMLLTGSYLVIQAIGGWLSGSLALLADSGHMLSDTAALALAWGAFHLSARAADHKRSYGYGRFQILAAFVNGLTLFAIAAWIIGAAIIRLWHPAHVLAGPMLLVALCGLAVNIIGFAILHRGDKHNVNMRGALLHVMGDLLGSVGAIAAALIIMFTGWMWADPLLAVLVAMLILRGAYDLVRRSGHILMEGVPEGLEPDVIAQDLMTHVEGLSNVHHVHVWALTNEQPLVTLHAVVEGEADNSLILAALHARLNERFGLEHSTVQIEGTPCNVSLASRCRK